MSNFDFLMNYLHMRVCRAYPPSYDGEGNFGVVVEDGEGYADTVIWFNKDGEVIEK